MMQSGLLYLFFACLSGTVGGLMDGTYNSSLRTPGTCTKDTARIKLSIAGYQVKRTTVLLLINTNELDFNRIFV